MIVDSLEHMMQRQMQVFDNIQIPVSMSLHLTLHEFLDATAEAVQRGVDLEHETSFSAIEISPQQSE